MKKTLPFLIYPALGLLAGWASVAVKDTRKQSPAAERAGEERRSTRSRERPAPAPVKTPDELLASVRTVLATTGKTNRTAASIEGWSDEEILAALDEAARMPEAILNDFSLALNLLRAYAAKNPEGALEWAIRLPGMQRGKFISEVLRSWPAERVDEAIALVKKHSDIFGREVSMSLVMKSVTAGSSSGPQAVIDRLSALMADGGFNRYTPFPDKVADGFDYGGLLSSPEFQALELGMMKSSLIQQWSAKDREAVFEWLLQKNGPGAIFDMRPPTWETTPEKSAAQARWMVGKVEALSQEQQQEFLKRNADRFRQTDADALVWIEAAKNPELRDAIRTAAATSVFSENSDYVDRGLQALGTLPDGESRIRALETLIAEKKNPYFSLTGEVVQKQIRTRLTEWGADAARVDAILRGMNEKTIRSK